MINPHLGHWLSLATRLRGHHLRKREYPVSEASRPKELEKENVGYSLAGVKRLLAEPGTLRVLAIDTLQESLAKK